MPPLVSDGGTALYLSSRFYSKTKIIIAMNLLKNTLVSKLMLAALMLVGARSAFAASELSIPSVAFNDYEVKEIPVTFKHGGDMGALQFDVKLSKSLEFDVESEKTAFSDAVVRNAAFFSDGQNMSGRIYNLGSEKEDEWARVLISTRRGNAFAAAEGVVVTLRVKVKPNHLDKTVVSSPEFAVTISNAKASDATGTKTETVSCPAASGDQVSAVKMSVEGGDFVMNPATEVTVALNLDNIDTDVAGMQFDMVVPEGFSVKNYQLTNRASNGAFLDYFPDKTNPNDIRFIVSDELTNQSFAKNEGAIMTFTLVAPAEFGETAVLKVKEILVSSEVGTGNFKNFRAPDFTVTITNGSNAKAAADAEVKALKDALAAAIAEIAEKYADVKDQFTGADITTNITTLEQAIAAAYGNNTLASKYDEVMAPKADITAAIAKLVEDAKAAQAKVDADKALKAAAEKAAAEIKALNDKLAAALESIAKNCPLVADDFKGENVAAAIKALQDKVDAAVADGSLTEKYDEVMANTIGELIDTLVKEAEIAQAAAVEAEAAEKARKENNEKAYKEDLAAIDELTAKLQAEIKALEDHFNAIGETEPNWVLVEQTNILVKIRDLKTKADNENDRVAKEGDYRKQVDALDTMLVNQLIAAYVANVKTSGIDSIISDENLGNVRIYTIDGVQHNTLVPGVNIIVKEDGTTTKVYVK